MDDSSNGRLWLVDAGYMIKAQTSVGNEYRFDYLKLRQHLERDGDLWRAYYLNSTPNPPSDAQDSFHTWLRTGSPKGPKIITKLYKLRDVSAKRVYCEHCRKKVALSCPNGEGHRIYKQQQKGVDVGIATLALVHGSKYRTLVLSSGDSDLLDAVEHLSEEGKRIELLVFRYGVSSELQSRADTIYWIDDFAADVAQESKAPPVQQAAAADVDEVDAAEP